jgi:hypothetical protein
MYMLDPFDLLHYLIGILIISFLVWALIQVHNYFSKDNVLIPNQTLNNTL